MQMTSSLTRKIKQQAKLVLDIFRDVTTDTTNKDPRPEDPRRDRGIEVKLSDLLATCQLRDTTNKSDCSIDDDELQSGSSEGRTY